MVDTNWLDQREIVYEPESFEDVLPAAAGALVGGEERFESDALPGLAPSPEVLAGGAAGALSDPGPSDPEPSDPEPSDPEPSDPEVAGLVSVAPLALPPERLSVL